MRGNVGKTVIPVAAAFNINGVKFGRALALIGTGENGGITSIIDQTNYVIS